MAAKGWSMCLSVCAMVLALVEPVRSAPPEADEKALEEEARRLRSQLAETERRLEELRSAETPGKEPEAAPSEDQRHGSDAGAPNEKRADESRKKADGDITYVVRLRDLEQRVNDLKAQIKQTHRRLGIEQVVDAGSGVMTIRLKGDISGWYRLLRMQCALDGVPVLNQAAGDGPMVLPDVLFRDEVPAGEHTLSVTIEFAGSGHGILTYVDDYRVRMRGHRSYKVVGGEHLVVTIIVRDSRDPLSTLDERLGLAFWARRERQRSHAKTNEARSRE